MGSGLSAQAGLPADASDITDLEQAKKQIVEFRAALKAAQGHNLDGKNYPIDFRKAPSCMMECLTPEMYAKFANVKGPRGYTFDQAIQCGLDGRSATGLAIPDEESYFLWKEFYDAVIDKKHNGFPADAVHTPDLDITKIDSSKLPADLNDYCVSTRIRAARNISGLGLPPGTTRHERREVERIVKAALTNLTGELKGQYFGLASMTPEQETQLQADHFLFQKPNPDAMISACGGTRDWPDARGIYHNDEKTFLVWVNEEDQMRVISMQAGGNVDEVFKRWVNGVNEVEKAVVAAGYKWMTHPHLGMFSSCVSNLGTGLRASMHIKLPKILAAVGQETLDRFCLTMRMQCRGTGGEHTEAGADGKVDISNWDRIGKSEVELVQVMIDGVCRLITLDKKAAAGEDIKAEMEAAISGMAAKL